MTSTPTATTLHDRETAHRALLETIAGDVRAGHRVPCLEDNRAPSWIGNGTPAQQRAKADQCLDCPAFLTCLDYVTTHGERSGVWAGTTQSQRDAKGRPRP